MTCLEKAEAFGVRQVQDPASISPPVGYTSRPQFPCLLIGNGACDAHPPHPTGLLGVSRGGFKELCLQIIFKLPDDDSQDESSMCPILHVHLSNSLTQANRGSVARAGLKPGSVWSGLSLRPSGRQPHKGLAMW